MPGKFISDAEMAALEAGQSAPAVSAPRNFISDAEMMELEAASSPSGDFNPNSTSAQIGKGLTFGWFDELQGLEKGAQNSIRNLLGAGDGRGFWDTYDATVAPLRATDRAVEEQNPWASVGLQAAGGLLPLLASGGTTAAPTTATKVAGLLYGAGTKGAPTVGQLAKMGAAGGALYGAGEANEGSRLLGAGLGGAVGGIAAPVVGYAAQKGTEAIGDFLANKQLIPDFASETGSIFGGKAAPKPYTPGELLLAKELKNTPIEKILAGASDIDSAVSRDIPLFLPEALNSPNVDRNARYIANFDPSMEFAQDAISARTKTAEARASNLFGNVSREESPYQGASKLAKAADDIIKAAEKARGKEAKPLYDAAYEAMPVMKSDALDDLLSKDQVLSRLVSDVKKTFENADLPDNATAVLVKARGRLGDKIDTLIKNEQGAEARDLKLTYDRLNDILHSNTALKTADKAYESASGGIEKLTDTFLSSLRKETENKVQKVSQIFNLSPERITSLRQTFIDAGKLDEWNAGIRAHLQNVVENTGEGKNFADKIIGNTAREAKLSAALGGESEAIGGSAYQKVAEGLNLEDRMFKGKNKYHAGSSTQGNQAEAKEFEKAAGFLSKITDVKAMASAVIKLFDGGISEDAAKELAKIYFDPKTGARTINKITPLLKRYAKTRDIAGALGKGTAVGATRSGQSFVGSQLNPSRDRAAGSPVSNAKPLKSTQAPTARLSESGMKEKKAPSPSPDFTSDPDLSKSRNSAYASAYKRSSFMDTVLDRAEGRSMDKAPVAIIEEQIDADPYYSALYEAESGRNPLAKNPTSSATGGFQFIKRTAQSLGLDDPTDLGKSFEAVQKLTKEIDAVANGDPFLRYAGHYLGAPLLKKWLEKKSLSDTEEEQVRYLKAKALPRFQKIYKRIAQKKAGVLEA